MIPCITGKINIFFVSLFYLNLFYRDSHHIRLSYFCISVFYIHTPISNAASGISHICTYNFNPRNHLFGITKTHTMPSTIAATALNVSNPLVIAAAASPIIMS